jgi:hypothetical protein
MKRRSRQVGGFPPAPTQLFIYSFRLQKDGEVRPLPEIIEAAFAYL